MGYQEEKGATDFQDVCIHDWKWWLPGHAETKAEQGEGKTVLLQPSPTPAEPDLDSPCPAQLTPASSHSLDPTDLSAWYSHKTQLTCHSFEHSHWPGDSQACS